VAAMLSVLTAAALGHAVAGRLSAAALRDTVAAHPAGRALLGAMVDAAGWKALRAVALWRLPPQVPFAVGNVLAAALGVRQSALLGGHAVGDGSAGAAGGPGGQPAFRLGSEPESPGGVVVGVGWGGSRSSGL